jgi:hypothetical protein
MAHTAPLDHPLSLTMQAVLTYGSWTITLVLAVCALRMSLRRRSAFPVVMLFSGMVAAVFEPLYDVGFQLLFYIPGQWTVFTSFGTPQPPWTFSGYAVLYAGPALFICDRIEQGMSGQGLLKAAGLVFLASCLFEGIGINGGVYEYYGAHALRVFDYPLAVGALETTFVIALCMAATALRHRLGEGWPLLALFGLFPALFYGVNFGIGAPVLVAINMPQVNDSLVLGASLLSVGVGLMVIWLLSRALPSRLVEHPSPAGRPPARSLSNPG